MTVSSVSVDKLLARIPVCGRYVIWFILYLADVSESVMYHFHLISSIYSFHGIFNLTSSQSHTTFIYQRFIFGSFS